MGELTDGRSMCSPKRGFIVSWTHKSPLDMDSVHKHYQNKLVGRIFKIVWTEGEGGGEGGAGEVKMRLMQFLV